MRFKLAILVSTLVILGLGLAFNEAAAQGRAASCTIRGFHAVIRRGPTQGLRLSGTLRLTANASGALSGNLLSEDRQVYISNITGRVNGRAINIGFDFGYSGRMQAYLFAVGTLWEPFSECSGAMGGLFTGPQAGDIGDWWVLGDE